MSINLLLLVIGIIIKKGQSTIHKQTNGDLPTVNLGYQDILVWLFQFANQHVPRSIGEGQRQFL